MSCVGFDSYRPPNPSSTTPLPHPLSITHLSHSDIFELWGKGEDSEQLNLTQRWFQQLVVCSDGLVGQVVVTGYTTKFCHLAKKKRFVGLHLSQNMQQNLFKCIKICSNQVSDYSCGCQIRADIHIAK